MSKNKKSKKVKTNKNAFDLKALIEKVKLELDPKTRGSRVTFKNESFHRIMEIYSLIAGVVIVGITVVNVALPINNAYPFNFSQASAVKQSIANANGTTTRLEEIISKASTDKGEVLKQKDKVNEFAVYFPSKIDPLSFMVHLEKMANKNDVVVHTLTLPENRRSAVVTDNVDVTQQGTTPSQPSTPVDNGTMAQDPNAQNGQATTTTPETTQPNATEPVIQDPGYVIEIKVVGMYSKLTAFFNDLEDTREIIDITDVVIEEYDPDADKQEAEQAQSTEGAASVAKINASSFDMENIQTQVSFKVKLYDDKTFAEFVNNIMMNQEKIGTSTPTNNGATPQAGQTPTTPAVDPNQQNATTNGGTGQ